MDTRLLQRAAGAKKKLWQRSRRLVLKKKNRRIGFADSTVLSFFSGQAQPDFEPATSSNNEGVKSKDGCVPT
jgi:hypothetical protein